MERKNQKIADLAEMFGSMDIEVIEGVLDQCGGKANTAAAVLLKMQEESTTNAVSVPQTEQKDELLDENFLEIDSPGDERRKKELEEENVKKEVEQVAFKDFQDEQAYFAEMQKAIESSLKTSKKPEKKPEINSSYHRGRFNRVVLIQQLGSWA